MLKLTNSCRHLKLEDRMTIASLNQHGNIMRAVASLLSYSASTVSRELLCKAHSKTYDSLSEQRVCQHRRLTHRSQLKLHTGSALFGDVHILMRSRRSPLQIAMTLKQKHNKCHEIRVSHEPIYNCVYTQTLRELLKDLNACLRQTSNKRPPRSKGQYGCRQIQDIFSIHVRPHNIEDRQFPASTTQKDTVIPAKNSPNRSNLTVAGVLSADYLSEFRS